MEVEGGDDAASSVGGIKLGLCPLSISYLSTGAVPVLISNLVITTVHELLHTFLGGLGQQFRMRRSTMRTFYGG